MRKLTVLLFLISSAACSADKDFNGRWNLKASSESRNRAWWLEVTGAGTEELKGRFVGAPGGGLDEIPEIAIRNGELVFSFERGFRVVRGQEPQLKKGVWSARLIDDKLQGTFGLAGESAPRLNFVGTRAPVLTDRDDGTWREGSPVKLFNGRDLSNWLPMVSGRELGWTVKDGFMTNVAGANNLVSKEKFWNFRLHAELRLSSHSNSGIGLRGRYEVQVLEDYGRPPSEKINGSVYSRIAPTANASKRAGEWQTYDITLVGRQVTVVLNGQKIIDKQEIEGLTAMAHDPNEADPGPISLQGDHGPVEFRSLVVTPLAK
jgi:hypothetical protein